MNVLRPSIPAWEADHDRQISRITKDLENTGAGMAKLGAKRSELDRELIAWCDFKFGRGPRPEA